MADLRDEHGNPIQLTDQYGKPVQLTDEYGNPMHLTGVAARSETAAEVAEELSGQQPLAVPVRPHDHQKPTGTGAALKHNPLPAAVPPEQIRRSGSSSSSSEDDGEGGRRKKGSLKEKLKGAFGGSHKDNAGTEGAHTHATTTATHSVPATTTTGTTGPAHSKTSTTEHEKKGFMEKIKEKLPGHHHGTN